MLKTKLTLATAAAVALLTPAFTATTAYADGYYERGGALYTPGIDRRIANQTRRIRNGKHDGSLTRREYRKLKRKLDHICYKLEEARYDGIVTRYERKHIRRALNRNSDRIARLRHNGRYDYGY